MLSLNKTVLEILAIGAIVLHLWARPALAAGTCTDCLAQVTAARLHLRAGPDLSTRSVVLLHRKDRLRVIDASGQWWKVSYEGETGFVDRRYVKLVTEEAAAAPLTFGSPVAQLRQVKERLKERQGEAGAYTQQESNLMDSLNKIDASLNVIEQKAAVLTQKVDGLTAQIVKKEAAETALERQVADLRTYAASRLVAVYKLNRLGTLPLIASAGSFFDFLIRKERLERLSAYDARVWHTLTVKQADLAALKAHLTAQREALRPQSLALAKQKAALTRQRDERNQLLFDIKTKKSLALAAIAALKRAAEALNREIATDTSTPNTEAPPSDFKALKGLLNLPVRGTIISFYGPYTSARLHVTGFRSGIDIAADRGEPIRAVDRGKTIFAGWFKGYGNMIIIDHGDHYCTVYAHAQELFKKKGESVASGEVIGTVGDTGSFQGPELHFEIRHHGRPVDPLTWLGKRSRNNYDKRATH
jgi:septal ring factor EnvC (AmiA/AmiB activator)